MNWLCRLFGHRWKITGLWKLYDGESWRRCTICKRCGDQKTETVRGNGKPLDVVQL